MAVRSLALLVLLATMFVHDVGALAGSHTINITKYPYLVRVFKRHEENTCAGVYVHKYWVLTGLECVRDTILGRSSFGQAKMWCCMGGDYLTKNTCFVRSNVRTVHRSDDLSAGVEAGGQLGIAMLQMHDPFPLGATIQYATFIPVDEREIRATVDEYYGKKCTLVGWGDFGWVGDPKTAEHYYSNGFIRAADLTMATDPSRNRLLLSSSDSDTVYPCNHDLGVPVICDGLVIGLVFRVAATCEASKVNPAVGHYFVLDEESYQLMDVCIDMLIADRANSRTFVYPLLFASILAVYVI